MRYLISALDDLGEMFKGRRIAPIEFCETGRKSLLTSFGYQGMSMIAVASRDMAARDAPARAAGVPVCALLGGSVGPVPAYNSNGLGLRSPTDRRARSSSRASMRIQLPACNTRIPTPATLGQPELHYPSNRCVGPW
jgi:L-alanine-DL-glutamate epimerase-like enolase superfamily enzyme